ncbi:MAG: SUMF1/EgtB/PvdO family nonheme iron enzyme, partial [Bernardetiaceae bacterium]
MNILSGFQAREVILLVQETKVAEAFARLDSYGVRSTELEELRREFIYGKYSFDYYDRLQLAINYHAKENFEIRTPDFDVFFSFSSKNLDAAAKEVQKLRDAGLKVFFSGDSLKDHVGQNFFEKIQHALERTQHFVLYGTREALDSPWVTQEYQSFYQYVHLHNPKKRRFFIISAKGFNINSLPMMMRGIQVGKTIDVIQVLRQETTPDTKPSPGKKPIKPPLSAAERKKRQQLQRRIFSGVGILLLLLVVGYGIFTPIPTEADRWQEAKAKSTPEAIQEFIKSYPNGDHYEAARQILDKFDQEAWETISKANDLDAYQSYIKTFPQGRYFPDAKSKADSIKQVAEANREARYQVQRAFRKATDENTVEAYDDFLKNYSDSEFAKEAKKRRSALNPSVITETISGVSFDMLYVEGGTFEMGYDPQRDGEDELMDDAKPPHRVQLTGYYMGEAPITRGQFRKFIEATNYRTDAEKGTGGWDVTNPVHAEELQKKKTIEQGEAGSFFWNPERLKVEYHPGDWQYGTKFYEGIRPPEE